MNKISFVGSCSFRTYFYLKLFKIYNIEIQEVFIYDYKPLDISMFKNKKLEYTDFKINIDESIDSLFKYFDAKLIRKNSINDMENELKVVNTDFFIFSGKGGEIVKENILSLNKFLHIHPGKLPSYKGSTTIYYSLLKESKCYASAFFLDSKIDTGDVIKCKEFHILDLDFDYLYDPFIRAYLLYDIIKDNNFEALKQSTFDSKEYYIIHPVLKKLALLKKERILKNEKNI